MRNPIFKSGSSLALKEVEIERAENASVLRPARQRNLAGVGEIFAMFSPGFMSEGREFHKERERDWNVSGVAEGSD